MRFRFAQNQNARVPILWRNVKAMHSAATILNAFYFSL
jgi:hypothetical protein